MRIYIVVLRAVDKYNVYNVVADVSFTLHLLAIVPRIGQQRRDVEHDLVPFVYRIH